MSIHVNFSLNNESKVEFSITKYKDTSTLYVATEMGLQSFDFTTEHFQQLGKIINDFLAKEEENKKGGLYEGVN